MELNIVMVAADIGALTVPPALTTAERYDLASVVPGAIVGVGVGKARFSS
jgi:hypothetical protein